MREEEAPGSAKPAPARGEEGDPNGGGFSPPDFRGLRSKTHTYAVARDGKWLLYDNVKDPYQQHNLIEDPSQKPLIDRYNTLIEGWLKEADDPFDLQTALAKRSAAPA